MPVMGESATMAVPPFIAFQISVPFIPFSFNTGCFCIRVMFTNMLGAKGEGATTYHVKLVTAKRFGNELLGSSAKAGFLEGKGGEGVSSHPTSELFIPIF